MAQQTFTPPNANPSMALVIPGFPFVQSAGSGLLGNNAHNEIVAGDQNSSAQAAKILAAQKQTSHTPGDRIV